MNRLILLAATIVLATGVMFAQSSPEAIENTRPDAAHAQTQPGTQATPPMVPHQPPDTTADPDRSGATPQTTLPSTTIDDQQPGSSTTGAASSTMGTTGGTPGGVESTEGNKSGTTPNDTQVPKSDNTQNAKPDKTEPHGRYSSGSDNPSSSANGASSDDMSGTSPRPDTKPDTTPDNRTNSTNPQTTPPHAATHTPDAGTEMNPASLEVPVSEQSAPSKQTSSYLPLAGAIGMYSLVMGMILER